MTTDNTGPVGLNQVIERLQALTEELQQQKAATTPASKLDQTALANDLIDYLREQVSLTLLRATARWLRHQGVAAEVYAGAPLEGRPVAGDLSEEATDLLREVAFCDDLFEAAGQLHFLQARPVSGPRLY